MDTLKLYNKSKTGKLQEWSIEVIDNTSTASIITKSGYIDGKIKTTDRIIKDGGNIGRSNEQTPYQVACTKAIRQYIDRVKDNWVKDISDAGKITFVKPMLAAQYDAKKIKFPCYVQRKMNGVRATVYRHLDNPAVMSRENNEYTAVRHIQDAVEKYFGNYSPDGEIFNKDMTFQEIISNVKKYHKGETEKLQYWIYDLAIPNKTFQERCNILTEMSLTWDNSTPFVLVDTYIAHNHTEMKTLHDQFVVGGYEGAIIRDPDGMYGFNDRPNCLMKYKEFYDDEFEVIGFKTEVWYDTVNEVHRNLVMYVCITKEGKEFDVRPVGSFQNRENDLLTANDKIGKMYTVRYQALSDDGIPVILTGQGFRDYE